MNCRTFPRTLSEAFPRTTHYACALERPAPRYPKALWAVLALGFTVAMIAART